MNIIIIITVGLIPFMFIAYSVVEKKEYEYILIIPFYFVFLSFLLYEVDRVYPYFLR